MKRYGDPPDWPSTTTHRPCTSTPDGAGEQFVL